MLKPHLMETFLVRHKGKIDTLSMSHQGVLFRCLRGCTTDGWGYNNSTYLTRAETSWTKADVRNALREMAVKQIITVFPLDMDGVASSKISLARLFEARDPVKEKVKSCLLTAWRPARPLPKYKAPKGDTLPSVFAWKLSV